MNSVPTVFRQRVAETWNCCELFFGLCKCGDSFPLASVRKKTDITLCMAILDGKWRYGFTNPDLSVGNVFPEYDEIDVSDNGIIDLEKYRKITLTMDELLKRQDLNDLRISAIIIRQNANLYWIKALLKELDVGMQKLLNCVCFLSNKPQLDIMSWKYFADADSGMPDREVLKQWIEKWQFSLIGIREYTSADNQLVEQKLFSGRNCFQFSRTPWLCVLFVIEGRDFLEKHLKSGQLTCFQSLLQDCVFPFTIMALFINDFMETPEGNNNKNFHIEMMFDETTPQRLEEMLKEGICDFRGSMYLFNKSQQRLAIWQLNDKRHAIALLHSTP